MLCSDLLVYKKVKGRNITEKIAIKVCTEISMWRVYFATFLKMPAKAYRQYELYVRLHV